MFDKLRSYFTSGEGIEGEHKERIEQLERVIGITIDNPFLYIRALRHRSILASDQYSPIDSYERLEFLGDAVLDLIVTEMIFDRFPDEDEGFLTKLRAKIVKGDSLAEYARELDLGTFLVLGERAQGQGIEFSKSVLADVFEALVGAMYMDKGYEDTYRFFTRVVKSQIDFEKVVDTLDNYKSLLLEYTQAHKLSLPEYRVVAEHGPGHDKTFEIKVVVDGRDLGMGKGKSKKEAEQRAARAAMGKLGNENS